MFTFSNYRSGGLIEMTGLIFHELAQLEIIISLFFTVDSYGKIKYTFSHGLSKFHQRTD